MIAMVNRSVRPAVSELREIVFPEVEERVLRNGLRVYFYRREDLDLIRMSVVMDGGLSEGENGCLAMLASQMWQEGTRGMSGGELADRLERLGTLSQFGVGMHSREMTLVTPADGWRSVLPLVEEIVGCPSFPADALESVKERLASASDMNRDSVDWQSEALWSRLAFGERHPLARKVDRGAIMGVSRVELEDFYGRYLGAGNTRVFLTGRAGDDFFRELEECFGGMGQRAAVTTLNYVPFEPHRAPFTARKEMAGKLQSSVTGSILTDGLSAEESLDLRLTVFALGGYFGSRLQQNIREEKGLTYNISAHLLRMREGTLMKLRTDCANDYVDRVLEEVRGELRRLWECAPDEEEMVRIRRAEIGNLSEIVSSPFSIIDFVKATVMQGYGKDYFARRLRATLGLTSGRVAEMAERYLRPELMLTAVAGGDKR